MRQNDRDVFGTNALIAMTAIFQSKTRNIGSPN